MIPLMMQEKYKPRGWLGLILGSHLWFAFFPSAVATDVDFRRSMEALVRECGDRGKLAPTIVAIEDRAAAAAADDQNLVALSRVSSTPPAAQSFDPSSTCTPDWVDPATSLEMSELVAQVQQISAQLAPVTPPPLHDSSYAEYPSAAAATAATTTAPAQPLSEAFYLQVERDRAERTAERAAERDFKLTLALIVASAAVAVALVLRR